MNNWAEIYDLRNAATAAFYDALPETERDLTPATPTQDGRVEATVPGHPMPGELAITIDHMPVLVTAVHMAVWTPDHHVAAATIEGYRMDRPLPEDAEVCPMAEANAATILQLGYDGGLGLLNTILWDPNSSMPALDDITYDAEVHRQGTCVCGWSPLVDGREALR